MTKKRFRNYALWASLISQMALLTQLVALGLGYHIKDEDIKLWVGVLDIVLGILVLLGIVSNPTSPESKGYNL
jgi:uncharacterized membrane protein